MDAHAQARIARLMESWRVLMSLRDEAARWNNTDRINGLTTALKILDACIAIEEGIFAERDKFHQVTSDPDQRVLARLREIAAIRDVFAAERPAPAEAETPA